MDATEWKTMGTCCSLLMTGVARTDWIIGEGRSTPSTILNGKRNNKSEKIIATSAMKFPFARHARCIVERCLLSPLCKRSAASDAYSSARTFDNNKKKMHTLIVILFRNRQRNALEIAERAF